MMALSIKNRQNKGAGGARVKPGERLFLTKDGKHLVPAGHGLAASLYCSEFASVDKDEFELLSKNGVPDEPEFTPRPSAPPPGPPSTGKPKKASKAKKSD